MCSTDITYIRLPKGFCYLTAVMDCYSRRVISWEVSMSMDGKGRAFDNILAERLWRTVKYEEVLLKEYGSIFGARMELQDFFKWYNGGRRHHGEGRTVFLQIADFWS